jgi:2-C-methyl-D-erythritol 2,4-cyclodiphosphate synthase
MRIGTGFDVHRLVKDRKLVLGGVEITYEKGLLGHSDADVLLHAVADALLGAAGLGDIGRHFPDTASEYKDVSSLVLLEKVYELLYAQGYCVNNIDATIIAEAPKLFPHIGKMEENIAKVLNIDTHNVSVKATTTEGLGYTGEKKGIAAQAAASIVQYNQ